MSVSAKRIIGIAVVLAVACCVGAFALDRYVLSQTYGRVPEREISLIPTYELYQSAYPRTDVEFQLDEHTLRGHVYGPQNTRGLVVFRHGIFSHHQDYLPLITALVDKGWRVFAYDAIGCGESDGDSTIGMSQSPLDVAAAIDFARESGMAGDLPIALWGHSWGGYGVAAALASRPDVAACVTMSGFDTPVGVLTSSAESSFGLIGRLQEPFLLLNTVIDFGDAANMSASEAIIASGVPTLVIQGTGDTTVPYEGASILGALEARGADTAESTIRLVKKTDSGRDGHNNYFYAPESQSYLNECTAELQRMLEENGDDVSDVKVRAYANSVDLLKANTADPALIDEIDGFLAANI